MSGLSIVALIKLAKTCPSLKTVCVPVDRVGPGEDVQRMKEVVELGRSSLSSSSELEELVFLRLPEEWDYSVLLVVALSAFIHCLFPRAERVEYRGHRVEWWKGVRAMIDNYQRVKAASNL